MKYPHAQAQLIAEALVEQLAPSCIPGGIAIAGSLRRKRPEVGDIEIVYIPRILTTKDLFGETEGSINCANAKIQQLEEGGVIDRRLDINGRQRYGRQIKLMRDPASGIPIDLFATTRDSWHNYLFCRTGPSRLNVLVASRAIERGLKWQPYSPGFIRQDGTLVPVTSEAQVLETVDLPPTPPEKRETLTPGKGVPAHALARSEAEGQ